MQQSIIDKIKLIEGGFAPLVKRIKELDFASEYKHSKRELNDIIERIEQIPEHTEEVLKTFFEYLRQVPKQTEDELNALIEHLKKLPKQHNEEIRTFIKKLKYLPSLTRVELKALVEHLECLSEHTDEELIALNEHIKYLPLQTAEESNAFIERIGQLALPQHTVEESNELIKYIRHSEILPVDIQEGLISLIKRITLIKHLKFVESIKHLVKSAQEELIILTDLIKKHLPDCEMIILFGSYARGTEVVYDEYYENGTRTLYQSDLDIMVVIQDSTPKGKLRSIERILSDKVTNEYDAIFLDRRHAPPQFITETIERLSKYLKRKQCFFTEIVADGMVLYNTGRCFLPEPQELSFRHIKEIAEQLFAQCIAYADGFLEGGCFYLEKEFYGMAAFQSHQSCENYYRSLGIVFDNFNPKLHDLEKFIAKTKSYSRDLVTVFPLNTDFEKRCFKLLCDAYVHARYDANYVVTKEELEYMLERIEMLKVLSYRLCKEKMEEYDRKMEEQETSDPERYPKDAPSIFEGEFDID